MRRRGVFVIMMVAVAAVNMVPLLYLQKSRGPDGVGGGSGARLRGQLECRQAPPRWDRAALLDGSWFPVPQDGSATFVPPRGTCLQRYTASAASTCLSGRSLLFVGDSVRATPCTRVLYIITASCSRESSMAPEASARRALFVCVLTVCLCGVCRSPGTSSCR
jgi:hypothetical protein